MEVKVMTAIVEFPHVVRQAVDEFRDIFQGQPQRRNFGEYLTGLMIASNKSVKVPGCRLVLGSRGGPAQNSSRLLDVIRFS
jgi:hypothetical protein